MTKTRVKLKDIADEAGVSPSLVSLILNGKGRASPPVRRRVQHLLEKYGMKPRYTQWPFLFLADVPRITACGKSGPVFSQLTGAQREFAEDNITLLLEIVEQGEKELDRDAFVDQCRRILQRKIGGVMVNTDSPWLELACEIFTKEAIPIVQLGYDTEAPQYNSVVVDSFAGAYAATKYLIDQGHTRIATLRWDVGIVSINSNKKFAGFRTAMDDANLAIPNDYVKAIHENLGDPDCPPARQLVDELFALPEPPTALFVENSATSLSLLYPMPSDNGKVPDRIATLPTVHFEDWPLMPVQDILTDKLFHPFPETLVVAIDWEEVGALAARNVVEQAGRRKGLAPQAMRIAPHLERIDSNMKRHPLNGTDF